MVSSGILFSFQVSPEEGATQPIRLINTRDINNSKNHCSKTAPILHKMSLIHFHNVRMILK